jgi:hypothetical protein
MFDRPSATPYQAMTKLQYGRYLVDHGQVESGLGQIRLGLRAFPVWTDPVKTADQQWIRTTFSSHLSLAHTYLAEAALQAGEYAKAKEEASIALTYKSQSRAFSALALSLYALDRPADAEQASNEAIRIASAAERGYIAQAHKEWLESLCGSDSRPRKTCLLTRK